MKKVVVPQQHEKQPKIDWNEKQWVICHHPLRVVLTDGVHNSEMFVGTCMPCYDYPKGIFENTWIKSMFQPLTFDIPFVISNLED